MEVATARDFSAPFCIGEAVRANRSLRLINDDDRTWSRSPNKGAVMRRLLVALGLVGLISQASAGEFELPTLRGTSPFIPAPQTHTLWSGFYAGGQVGYGSTHFDFSDATKSLVEYMLRQLSRE
jgi:hypothetical protein